jgi:tetrahydromethanopterin S-methyltransferase subunit F
MSPQTSPQPISAPTRRFAIGFLIGIVLLATLLWLATG